eukprot:CFRG6972T1
MADRLTAQAREVEYHGKQLPVEVSWRNAVKGFTKFDAVAIPCLGGAMWSYLMYHTNGDKRAAGYALTLGLGAGFIISVQNSIARQRGIIG